MLTTYSQDVTLFTVNFKHQYFFDPSSHSNLAYSPSYFYTKQPI